MKLYFHSSDFVVVEKPAQVLSVPSRMGTADARPVLGLQLQAHLGIPVYPVHRLDFEVKGLILFALSAKAHSAANGWFEKKEIKKTYLALTIKNEVWQVGQNFSWECLLLRGKKRAYEHIAGKPSLTLAKILRCKDSFWEWELQPITGRSHQLRYELFRHQLPILGDQLYGNTQLWHDGAIALVAQKIQFPPQAQLEWKLPEVVSISETW